MTDAARYRGEMHPPCVLCPDPATGMVEFQPCCEQHRAEIARDVARARGE